MAKINRKKQRLIAWIAVIVVILIISTIMGVAFVLLKNPIANRISEMKQTVFDSNEEVTEIQEEEPEESETVQDDVMSEEMLNEIFDGLEEEPEETEEEEVDEDEELSLRANEILDEMSMEDMVAQLFFVTPESITGVDVATAAGEATKAAIDEYPVGGIILFAKNIENPEQIVQMTSNLQKYSDERISLPIFIGVDEEGGKVSRIASNENFDVEVIGPMDEIGESGDTQRAYDAGSIIGRYLSEYGFNVDFAPDADVLMDGVESIIGNRSFGTEPEVVADMCENYLAGLNDNDVIGVAKHYPGHGSTSADTHTSAAIVDKSWDELLESDIIPFKRMIDNNIPMIMISHISVPQVTGDEIPASMSGILITEKLRAELGYKGVVITDSMSMEAVSKEYSAEDAVVEALRAGVDMILMPSDFDAAYKGVLLAIEDEKLTKDRIRESAFRVVKLKLSMEELSNSSEETENE